MNKQPDTLDPTLTLTTPEAWQELVARSSETLAATAQQPEANQDAAAPEAAPLDVAAERQKVAQVHAEAAERPKLPDMTLRQIGQTAIEKGQTAVVKGQEAAMAAKAKAVTGAQQVKQSPRTIAAVETVRSKIDAVRGKVDTARRMYQAAAQEAKAPAPHPAVAPETVVTTPKSQPEPKPVEAAKAPVAPKPAAPRPLTPAQRLEREISSVLKREDYTKAIEEAAQGKQVNADTFMNLLDGQGIDRRTANKLVELMQKQGQLETDSRRIRLVQEGDQHFLEGNYAVRPQQHGQTLGQRYNELTSAPEKDDTQPLFNERTFNSRGKLESGFAPSNLKLIMNQVKQWETVSEQDLSEQFKLPPEASSRLIEWMTRKNLLEQSGTADKPELRLSANAEEILQNTLLNGPVERRAKRLPHPKPSPNQTPVVAPAKPKFSRLKHFFSPARLKGNIKYWANELRPRKADVLAMVHFVKGLHIWSLNPKHNLLVAYMDNLRRPEDKWLPAPVKPAKQQAPEMRRLTVLETLGFKGIDGEPILTDEHKAKAKKAGRVALKVLGASGVNHPMMPAEMAEYERNSRQH